MCLVLKELLTTSGLLLFKSVFCLFPSLTCEPTCHFHRCHVLPVKLDSLGIKKRAHWDRADPEARHSLTQIPSRRTWRSCDGLLCLLQRSLTYLTVCWLRRSWFPNLKPCVETIYYPGSTRMDWDGPKLSSTSPRLMQPMLRCLWSFSVLVRETWIHVLKQHI